MIALRAGLYYSIWMMAETIASYFDAVCLWAKEQHLQAQVHPLRGRMVRYIRTEGSMGTDVRTEYGVVTRTFKNRATGLGYELLFLEFKLDITGDLHAVLFRTVFENKEDGAFEYRY